MQQERYLIHTVIGRNTGGNNRFSNFSIVSPSIFSCGHTVLKARECVVCYSNTQLLCNLIRWNQEAKTWRTDFLNSVSGRQELIFISEIAFEVLPGFRDPGILSERWGGWRLLSPFELHGEELSTKRWCNLDREKMSGCPLKPVISVGPSVSPSWEKFSNFLS